MASKILVMKAPQQDTDCVIPVKKNKVRILLVDGFNLIRRIYEARPDPDINAVIQASVQSLQRALKEHRPTHAVVVFEDHDKTWRHLLYGDYKAGRSPTPRPLLEGIKQFEDAFQKAGVNSFSLASYEADDIIATFAHGTGKTHEAIILSSDKLYLQLLSDHISVVSHFDSHRFSSDDVQNRYGVGPSQLIDYWSLVGDSSGNIKGVPGIGAKTASRLLESWHSLDNMLKSEVDDRHLKKIRDHEDVARRCRQLVTLKTDVELGTNLRDYRLKIHWDDPL